MKVNPVEFYQKRGWCITSPFGYRIHPITGLKSHHNGIDFGGKPHGHPIETPYPGIVTSAQFYASRGNTVVIRLGWGSKCQQLCQHLSAFKVRVGDKVNPGDVIGLNGDSGDSKGAHLHYELRWAGSPWGEVWGDPATFILEEEDEMLGNVIIINTDSDAPAANRMLAKLPGHGSIMPRDATDELKNKGAKVVYILGGGPSKLPLDKAEKVVDLTGLTYFHTMQNSGRYIGTL